MITLTRKEAAALVARIESKTRPEPSTRNCRVWAASVSGSYPVVYLRGKRINARRLLWMMHNNKRRCPPHQIRTTCGLPDCLNPEHLYQSTVPNGSPDAIQISVG